MSSKAKTESTTVRTTKYSSSAGGARIAPIAAARTVVIQRSAPGAMRGMGSMSSSQQISRSVASNSFSAPGSQTNVTHVGVQNIKDGRDRERKDMRDLNERFANYIDKVRFLEAQNKKLANELAALKDKWGKETERIKAMYDAELSQLRKLLDDGERAKAELEVRISSLEDQINELQVLLDEANRQHNADRETIDKLNQQLADYEGEIALLRRRVNSMEEERSRDKKEIQRLREEVARLRTDLDQETLNHINAENEAQSLRDELEFLKQVHDAELKELAALAYRDTTSENREYWKSEMSQALHDIQTEYDGKMDIMKSEMESYYNLKVQEARTNTTRDNMELTHIKEENSRIKSLLAELRARIPELEARNSQLERDMEELRRELAEEKRECEMEKNQLRTDLHAAQVELEGVLHELQVLLDAKLSLELEIAAYRKLLEGEETRIHNVNQVNQVLTSGGGGGGGISATSMSQSYSAAGGSSYGFEGMESSMTTGGSKQQMSSIIKGEMSAKTTFQRTAKGNVSIQECSPDGKFIMLENTGNKKETVSNWRITRNLDGGRQVVRFTFPDNTVLGDGRNKTVKIWARGQKPFGSSDLECNEQSWGVGANIQTVLLNESGDERATHTQNTVYQAK